MEIISKHPVYRSIDDTTGTLVVRGYDPHNLIADQIMVSYAIYARTRTEGLALTSNGIRTLYSPTPTEGDLNLLIVTLSIPPNWSTEGVNWKNRGLSTEQQELAQHLSTTGRGITIEYEINLDTFEEELQNTGVYLSEVGIVISAPHIHSVMGDERKLRRHITGSQTSIFYHDPYGQVGTIWTVDYEGAPYPLDSYSEHTEGLTIIHRTPAGEKKQHYSINELVASLPPGFFYTEVAARGKHKQEEISAREIFIKEKQTTVTDRKLDIEGDKLKVDELKTQTEREKAQHQQTIHEKTAGVSATSDLLKTVATGLSALAGLVGSLFGIFKLVGLLRGG